MGEKLLSFHREENNETSSGVSWYSASADLKGTYQDGGLN